jgi:hypothetical protein
MFTFIVKFLRRFFPSSASVTEAVQAVASAAQEVEKPELKMVPPFESKAEPAQAKTEASDSATTGVIATEGAALQTPRPKQQQPLPQHTKEQNKSAFSLTVIPTKQGSGNAFEIMCYPLLVALNLLGKCRLTQADIKQFVTLFESNSDAVFRTNVATLLQAKDYRVELSKINDKDLIIHRDGQSAWVHTCNNAYASTHVTVRAFGQKSLAQAQKSATINKLPLIVVTGGRFGQSLPAIARAKKIMLLDGAALAKLMTAYGLPQ